MKSQVSKQKVQMLKSKVQIKFKKQKNHKSDFVFLGFPLNFELGTLALFWHLDLVI